MKTVCWVLTMIVIGLYLIDPWQEKINKGWIVLLYVLVVPVYFWKNPLFYPSLNVMLLGLIGYYLVMGYLI